MGSSTCCQGRVLCPFLIVRDLLEGNYNYTSALDVLSSIELVAPIYYIIGGLNIKEGALITRERYYNLNPVYLNMSDFILLPPPVCLVFDNNEYLNNNKNNKTVINNKTIYLE